MELARSIDGVPRLHHPVSGRQRAADSSWTRVAQPDIFESEFFGGPVNNNCGVRSRMYVIM